MSNAAFRNYEFVMLSRAKAHEQNGGGEGNPDLLVDSEAVTLEKTHFPARADINVSNDGCGFDQQRFDGRKAWCVYNVMLVQWKGGVTFRMGIGGVHIDAWAQANPRKRVVRG